MAVFKVKAKNRVDIDKKPRVYFTCHPEDFKKHFKKICEDIFKTHDCAIYYTEDMTEFIAEDEKEVDLGRNNLFVVPVTFELLTTPNRTMDADIPYALEKHIPVLPILMELVDDELYSSKFGELQYLNPLSEDRTEIPYEEKLKKYLESVLISKELADRIRHAFYAYIFLSYRKVDRVYANTLMRLIHSIPECRDFAIWFDEFLTPGESFKANIEKALDDCKLFTFLVTERLFKKNINKNGEEENNFVMAEELPKAKVKRAEKGTKIIAVEMENAEKDAPSILEADDYIRYDDLEFRDRILATISKIKYDAVNTPEHTLLMGLAYLEGIDMEVNRERAVELITSAADTDLPEAMAKLISMYIDGVGVSQDQDEVKKWSERLADYYFKRSFSKKDTIKSKKKIAELFANYNNKYWAETIKYFLIYADKRLPLGTIKKLYEVLMSFDICEYTLLFDACENMSQHQEETQIILVTDILTKSVDGTYPSYGPLFWYVPEYALYEVSLLTLDALKNRSDFVKMLALVRDVCWIFGQKNTCNEITDRVDSLSLFNAAKDSLTGVRKALCELFYSRETDYCGGEDIYPRCFNPAEAMSFMSNGIGILGRMNKSFCDELGLYSDFAYNKVDSEYIGLLSTVYDKKAIEKKLGLFPCKKISGLILNSSENTTLEYIPFNRKNVKVYYIPENIEACQNDCTLFMSLQNRFAFSSQKFFYYHRFLELFDSDTFCTSQFSGNMNLKKIHIGGNIEIIKSNAFSACKNLETVCMDKTVTKIGEEAFKNCKKLYKLNIHSDVCHIGSSAFENCEGLTELDLSDLKRLWSIDSEAFAGCIGLKKVILSKSTQEIYSSAFKNCIHLESINLRCVSEINSGAFMGCESITELYIPGTVCRIGPFAFSGCTSLRKLTVADGTRFIEHQAFENCTKLEVVIIPSSVEVIRAGAFSGCAKLKRIFLPSRFENSYKELGISQKAEIIFINPENLGDELLHSWDFDDGSGEPPIVIERGRYAYQTALKKARIPDSVRFIGRSAFSGCISLTDVTFPCCLETIGPYAFQDCVSLKKIVIPQYVHIIGEGVFEGCINLETVILPKRLKDKVSNLGLTTKTEVIFSCADSQVEIDPSTIIIKAYAYANYTELFSVNIPEGIQEIEIYAFQNCLNLQEVTIPATVEKIGTGAFNNCEKLNFAVIYNPFAKLSKSVFENCKSLRSVKLPEFLQELSHDIFKNCEELENISVPKSVTIIDGYAFYGCKKLTSIIIPESITKIGVACFENCKSLEKITIPKGIAEIDMSVFKNCINLTCVYLPDTIFEIGVRSFANCISLSKINIPERVIRIGDYAFCNCESIDIDIPQNVAQIGEGAFENCNNLRIINVPQNVTKISKKTFKGCENLIEVTISDNVTEFDNEAFCGCVSLQKIDLPKSLLSIGSGTFKDCHKLLRLEIPNSVLHIGDGAFIGCTGLKEIIISGNYETDIRRLFGDIDPSIISFI